MGLFRSVGVALDMPSDWSTREIEQRHLVVAYRAVDEGWREVSDLTLDFVVARHPTSMSFGAFVRSLMRKRVAQGYPTVLPRLFVDGRRALGVEWTDGVSDIATWFVPAEPGYVHEIQASRNPWLQRDVDHVALGRRLAGGIRWLRS